jgi:hypothetical protein
VSRDSDNDGVGDCDDITFDIASAKSRFTSFDSFVYDANGATLAHVEADFARLPPTVSSLELSEVEVEGELQSRALRSKVIQVRPDAGARFDDAGHAYLVGGGASICLAASRTIDLTDLCLGTYSRKAWSCLPGSVTLEESMLCGTTPHFSLFALIAPSALPATTTSTSSATPTTFDNNATPDVTAEPGDSNASSRSPVVPGPTTNQTTLIIIIVCVVGGLLLCGLLIGLLVWRAQRRSGARSMPESGGESRMSPMGGSIQSPSGVPLVDSAALDTVDRQCGKCNTWLTGMVVEAEGVFWHLRCFTCDLCTKPLKVGALERVGEHVYCASCAAEHSARPAASSLKRGSQKNRALAGSEIYVDEDPVVIVDGTSESDSPADVAETTTARRSSALSTDSRASKTKGKRPGGGAKVRDAEATARAKARAAAAREAARERHEEKMRERQKRDKAKQKQQQRAKRAPEPQSDSDSGRVGDSGRKSDVRFSGVFAALDNDGEGSDDSDKITLGPKASTQAMPSSPSPVASRKY